MDLSDLSGVVARALGGDLSWDSTQRLYHLAGPGDTSGLLLESWLAHESVGAPFVLRLLCLSTDAHLDPAAMLAQPVQLHTTLADGSRTSRSAIVLEAEPLASNGAAARYRLTAGPWLSLLAYARHSRVWQDRTPAQILEDVFSAYAAHAAWRFDDSIQPDLQASPSAGVRGLRVQYRETDLEFVQRVLATEGWSTRFEEDDTAPAGHRLVLFADS
ncbi:contractile injection system protein, VgrG/Pvc8 family, partial [Aquabacterium sp.]|uniref:contractile injection system protein, VgrG/Pvc8 family n=1 Tax=Aquabacterium sp. TaxID=1872578 RepID=UPI0035B415C3